MRRWLLGMWLCVGCACAQESLELTYEIERLGDAQEVALVSPGAGGSRYAVRLTHDPNDWSRFNWPAFRAVPSAQGMEVTVRRIGVEPKTINVRALRADGVEWRSGTIALSEAWQTVHLKADAFRIFRGAKEGEAAPFSFADVIQLQVVPLSPGKRDASVAGIMEVDDLRLLPDGPAFTHEGAEVRTRITDPVELEFARLNDLRARWSVEIASLQSTREGAIRWKDALAEVLAVARGGDVQAALGKLKQEKGAWVNALRPEPAVPDNPALPAFERGAFGKTVAALGAAQEQVLIDFSKRPKMRRYTMYQSPTQADVEYVKAGDEMVARQRIVFTGEQTRQVVFVTMDLPADADVENRRIFVRMRCTAKGLNEKQPLVLRLNVRNAENAEAWAQFKPQVLPGADWADAVFALESPSERVRFDPQSVKQLAFRIENVPGQADDFMLEIGEPRLGWPDPLGRVRADTLQEIDGRVREAREKLFAERAAVAKLEGALHEYSDVERAYWKTFGTGQKAGTAVRPSGVTTVLRHAVSRGWPDWSYQVDGYGGFGRFTAYSLPDGYTVDGSMRRMYDDLWLDGTRHYGFKIDTRTLGDHERQGLSLLAGAAPSYRALEGWGDVAKFLSAYENRCSLLEGTAKSRAVAVLQVGNEVELAEWGADLHTAFPGAPYQPLDMIAESVRRQGLTKAPVMYVRAGSLSVMPPLPHEDVCGVNQYTGRYSGRMDEIERNLAELAIQSMFADRPVMITEWMGPKYSWASGGIGGVTERGAAYYLERYWRGLIDTPGVVGSSEFTLNWVIAPFEDLTNQTREEAFRNRFKHSRFSASRSADHVPLMTPSQAVTGDCYRAMQAFHGPLYVMMQRPGAVTVAHDGKAAAEAERLAALLRELGKQVECVRDAAFVAMRSGDAGHVVAFVPEGDAVQTRVHPSAPDRLLVTVSGTDGIRRLTESAEALLRLRRQESAMGRVAAWIDSARRNVYERYILEQAARGYLMPGDDARTELDEADFYGADGKRRAAWSDWAALILDGRRALKPEELALVKRVCAEGVNVVVSLACYQANPGLREWCGAVRAGSGSLADRLPVRDALAGPIPVANMGGADGAVIARFTPQLAGMKALDVSWFTETGDAEVWATTEAGNPVTVAWRRGKGRVVLFGCDFGDAADVHWRVTHAGETHPLYDRDTACGLERLSRCVVNACLAGRTDSKAVRPRLYLRVVPDAVQVDGGLGAFASADVLLCDAEGRPVAGELLVKARMSIDGSTSGGGAFTRLSEIGPGRFRLICAPEGGGDGTHVRYAPPKRMGRLWTVLGVQLKAYAEGFVPVDGGAAFNVVE